MTCCVYNRSCFVKGLLFGLGFGSEFFFEYERTVGVQVAYYHAGVVFTDGLGQRRGDIGEGVLLHFGRVFKLFFELFRILAFVQSVFIDQLAAFGLDVYLDRKSTRLNSSH